MQNITFVAAVNDQDTFARNLLASPSLCAPQGHQILCQKYFSSASRAYNDALDRADNDLVVFVHQDIFLPEPWLSQLDEAVRYLAQKDPNWGVLGCWGSRADGQSFGHVYTSGWGVLGEPLADPIPVQTLDEIVLIVRKGSGLRFDETLPHFHFYGTDICMSAAKRGLGCYAISAFCIHNTEQLFRLPREFYRCYKHIKQVWGDYLPIQTSCIRVTRFDAEVYRRRCQELYRSVLHRRRAADRIHDPRQILKMLDGSC